MNSVDLLDPALVEKFGFDDLSVLDSTNYQQPLSEAQREMMTSIWNEVKAAP
jgi:hypothetical protein